MAVSWLLYIRIEGTLSASSALAWPLDVRDWTMKADGDDMRDEYDFSGGQRGRYVDRFSDGSNVVVLDPDVAEAFTSEREVNEALREALRRRKPGADG